MEALFLRAVTLSLGCSAVLLPLLLLSRRIHHRYAARTCYVLWLLLAFRLLLPVQFNLPEPVVTVEAPSYVVPIQRPAPPVPVEPVPNPGPAVLPSGDGALPAAEPEPVSTVSLVAIAGVLWLAGGAVFVLWQWGSYWLARRRLLARSVPAREDDWTALREGQRVLDLRRPVELRRVKDLPTPMMLGLFHPVILLPEGEMGEEARAMVLRHELVHLQRGDVAYKLLLLLANAVHWFNPLVWWMSREAGRNLELCCDDDVVKGQDKEFRRRYGEILIHTAAGCRAPVLSTYFGGGKQYLKGRLKNLFQHKKNSVVLVCVVLAAALLAGSLVACRAAEGRISETEAIDRLEQSIQYEEATGELSFTIPDADVPSQPWSLEISGRAVFEDGMSMSLHYHTNTEWEPGETYTENLAEVAEHLTELFIHVTLGIVEQPIDLLPYIRPGEVSQGKTDQPLEEMTPEEQAVDALVRSITYQDGDLWFTMPDYGASEDWRIRISGKDAGGSSHSHGNDCDFHYLEHETLQPGTTYAMNIPSGHWAELSTLELRVWLGDTFRLVNLMAYVNVPRSGVYSMEPPEGTEITGDIPMTPQLTIDAEARRFQLFSDMLSSYLPIGSYTVEGNVVTCATDDGARRYVFVIEDGDTLRFDQGKSSKMDHYDTSLAVPAYDGAPFRWTGGVPAQASDAGGTVYTNETYGFTLQFPESWAGHWQAEEDGRQVVFSAANIGETLDGMGIFQLDIDPEEREAITGRMELLGHKPGCWVYQYFFLSELPARRNAAQEERDLYLGMIWDLEDTPITLTFTATEPTDIRVYREVLLNEQEFLFTANGQQETIANSTLGESLLHPRITFAVADMDEDGQNEVAVMLDENTGVSLLLDEREGTVYGYEAYYRWYMPLKSDGTVFYSSGAASRGWGHVAFGEREFTHDRMNYCEGSNPAKYVVNGTAAALEQFDDAADKMIANPDAAWYPLTSEMVEALCSE